MNIAVIGAGAWGTALAQLLASQGLKPTLWCYEPELAAAINQHRQNRLYLPDIKLAEGITATTALGLKAELLFAATPARHLEQVLANFGLPATAKIVICAKGLAATGEFIHQRLANPVKNLAIPKNLAILSGPTFATEIASGKPAAAVVASSNQTLAEEVCRLFAATNLRLYTSGDVNGVALGGVMKNIIALAAGICRGYGLGHSAAASIIARGYAEMNKLATVLKADPQTLGGLSGLGDLSLTATSKLSRNFMAGYELGTKAKTKTANPPAIEGEWSAPIMLRIANRHHIDLPITKATAALLNHQTTVAKTVEMLMTRPLTSE